MSKIGHPRLQPPLDRDRRPLFVAFPWIETIHPSVAGGTDVVCGGVRVVWSGLVWSGLVWSGLVWSGLVWSGLVWSGLVWTSLGWAGMAAWSRGSWFRSKYRHLGTYKAKMNRTSCSIGNPGEYLHPVLKTLQGHRPVKNATLCEHDTQSTQVEIGQAT